MENIPSSPDEVKSIIEAVNLKTLERFTYLKTAQGICKFPISIVENGVKSLEAALDEFLWDAEDPDQEIGFMDPESSTTASGENSGGMVLFREREKRGGEGNDGQLASLRAQAAAEINTGRTFQKEVKSKATRPEKIIQLQGQEKQTGENKRPPRDVLKYFRDVKMVKEWKLLFFGQYKLSWFGPLDECGHMKGRDRKLMKGYAGKSKRKGRYYNRGNSKLAEFTGVPLRTVGRYLKQAKELNLILERKRGWKGEGCSIWELPVNLDHVFSWKRRHEGSRIGKPSGTA